MHHPLARRIMENISHYGKSITYIALAAVTFLVTALSDNTLAIEEILNLVVVVLGAIGVYAVPNLPEGTAKYAKTGIAFLTAAVIAALSFLTGGIVTSEWLQIIIAAFTAIGVYIVPNELKKTGVQPVEIVGSNAPAPTTNIVVAGPKEAAEVIKEVTENPPVGYHGI
jgi:hypothetical protein